MLRTKALQRRKESNCSPRNFKQLQEAGSNLNRVTFVKYDFIPEEVEIRALTDREYRKLDDFHMIEKVQKDSSRRLKAYIKSARRN